MLFYALLPTGAIHLSCLQARVRYFDNVVAWPSVEPTDDYTVLGIVVFTRLVS
jgi:hypothetical protein